MNMTLEQFEETINAIKFQVDRDAALMNLIGEGVSTYSEGLVEATVNLLKTCFGGDPHNWIEWWIWECDFGSDSARYFQDTDEYIDEEGTDISSIKDFYNYLLEK